MADNLRTVIEFDGDPSGAKRAALAAIDATKDSAQQAVAASASATDQQLKMQDKAVKQQFNLGDLSLTQYKDYLDKRLKATAAGSQAEARVRMEQTRLADVQENKGFQGMSQGAGTASMSLMQLGAGGQAASMGMNALSQGMQMAANKASTMQIAMMGVGAAIGVLMLVYQELIKKQQESIDKSNEEIAVAQKKTQSVRSDLEARMQWEYEHHEKSASAYRAFLEIRKSQYAEGTQAHYNWEKKIEELDATAAASRLKRLTENQALESAVVEAEAGRVAAAGAQQRKEDEENEAAAVTVNGILHKEQTDYKLQLIQEEYDRYAQVTNDKALLDEWASQQRIGVLKKDSDYEKLTYSQKLAALTKMRQSDLITEKVFAQAKVQITTAMGNAALTVYGGMFANLKTLFKENTVAYKAFAIAETVINTYKAAQAAWASGAAINPFLGAVAAAAAVAAGIANVAKIVAVDTSGGGGTVSTPSIATPSMGSYGESTGTTAGGGGGTTGGQGAETVSKAPQVVYYTAILNVAGSVIGVDRLAELFDEFNYNSLRALGRA